MTTGKSTTMTERSTHSQVSLSLFKLACLQQNQFIIITDTTVSCTKTCNPYSLPASLYFSPLPFTSASDILN